MRSVRLLRCFAPVTGDYRGFRLVVREQGRLAITPLALREVGGRVWRGPPKSPAAARRIDLPSFLVDLLARRYR
ncbi:site-specific integrase [Spongiactinospora rosea]|uniref:hypothetical protein n=1 Tax=Spongiactinospora rosea TaxID=2248750 RepID=UPI0018F73ACC|nr:hypothetical protein [Spongiactinospora rosea]